MVIINVNERWILWFGIIKNVTTVWELFDAVASCKTREEADSFTREYEMEVGKQYAKPNIGYVIGYGSDEDRKRLYKLFGDNHPIFGKC